MTPLQLELAEACALVLADAIADGHDPHPWATDALDAHTACRRCGARFEVRVRSSFVHTTAYGPKCPE